MSMSIYQISDNLNKIEELIEAGEFSPDDVRDTLQALEGDFYTKIDNILQWVKNLEHEAEAYKKESERLAKLAKRSETKARSLIQYVDNACKLMEKRKFATSHFKINYRKGAEVVEVDETELPQDFFVPQPPKPMSKTELKQYIKETGEQIPGVKLVRKPDSLVIQ